MNTVTLHTLALTAPSYGRSDKENYLELELYKNTFHSTIYSVSHPLHPLVLFFWYLFSVVFQQVDLQCV